MPKWSRATLQMVLKSSYKHENSHGDYASDGVTWNEMQGESQAFPHRKCLLNLYTRNISKVRGFGRASEITFGHVEVISPWSTYIQGKGVRSEGQNGDSHHLPFPRDALEVIHELGDMRVEGHERTIESERRG